MISKDVKLDKGIRIGVAVLVINYKNEILFLKKKDKIENGKKYHGNCYCLPGGKLEFKETIFSCARRELLEETNLIADNLELCGVTELYWENYNEHWLTFLVKANKTSGELKLVEPHKHEFFSWHTINKLPKPIFNADNRSIEKYLTKKLIDEKNFYYKGFL